VLKRGVLLSCFDSQEKTVRVLFIVALSVFIVPMVSLSHYAYGHSAGDSGATVKTIDNKYRIAFQLYPKFAIAGQNATLHFDIRNANGSNLVGGVYAALVMKEKEPGMIDEQMPYRFYESSDISIPYSFHDNSDHVATLLTRIGDDAKYLATPLQADFDIPVGQTMTSNEFLLMAVPFIAALAGGIVFVLKKIR
jgi:ABC-type cobalt transport system substrate-binding protein